MRTISCTSGRNWQSEAYHLHCIHVYTRWILRMWPNFTHWPVAFLLSSTRLAPWRGPAQYRPPEISANFHMPTSWPAALPLELPMTTAPGLRHRPSPTWWYCERTPRWCWCSSWWTRCVTRAEQNGRTRPCACEWDVPHLPRHRFHSMAHRHLQHKGSLGQKDICDCVLMALYVHVALSEKAFWNGRNLEWFLSSIRF